MGQMYNCTVEDCTLCFVYCAVATLSVVMCMVAIAVMTYYKFYYSFNYRLILYLLVSFLIKALITVIAFSLLLLLDNDSSYFDATIVIVSICWYSTWNIQLCITFMTAEIFSMVLFSVELQKVEIPVTIACFTLPLVELVGIRLNEQRDLACEQFVQFSKYNAILGMVVAGICAIAIAITLICLAYHGLRRRAINNNNDEQHLLHQHTRQRYRNALKESLPLIINSVMILLWLLVYNYFIFNITSILSMALDVSEASTGTISSIVFFIHIKILGQRRRNIFRNRSHHTPPSHSTEEINEEQRITVAGSITATHITDFDPLGDSDVEP